MKTNHPNFRAKGFTLIELLVVIAIIVVLAGLSVTGFNYVQERQDHEKTKLQIALISNALEDYKADNGEYPAVTTTNELYRVLYYDGASVTPPEKIYVPQLDPENNKQGWTEGTGATVKITDPWGGEYIYRIDSDPLAKNPDFDIVSKGKDGIEGNADDVDNF
jgi:general secretion pathway protein G